jgi:hypothetical protein
VTEYFAQRLVHHRNVRLAAKTAPKLPPHHAEGGLDVRLGAGPAFPLRLKSYGCPVLVSPFFGETEPALSEAEGAGTLNSSSAHQSSRFFLTSSPKPADTILVVTVH